MENKDIRLQAKYKLKPKHWTSVGVVALGYLIIVLSSNIGVIGNLFLGYPIWYGLYKYFMAVSNGFGDFDDLFSGFKESYMDNLLTLFLKDILVLLWSLLLIVPGIIKSIEYAMTPYILVDYDFNETHMDALRKSQELMQGYKMKYFKMQLNFLL